MWIRAIFAGLVAGLSVAYLEAPPWAATWFSLWMVSYFWEWAKQNERLLD